MIIYSEITGETYGSVNECIDAEVAYKRAKLKEKAEKEAKAKALDEAYEEAIAACNKYLKLVEEVYPEVSEKIEINVDERDIEDIIQDFLDFLSCQEVGILINKNKLLQLRIRLHKLQTNGKNEESPGVIRKIVRQIHQIERMGE